MSVVGNAINCHLFSMEPLVTLTLLVDLDNTLLGNDMETFIPAYLGAFGEHLTAQVSPRQMVAAMLSATQQMMENTNPARTLKAAFDPKFYPVLDLVESEIRPHIDQFYRDIFPNLQSKTRFQPDAVDFVRAALQRGYQVGVATNPLFPRTAIVQRLAWAGFSPEEIPFSLIPSYDTFHFAKPNPAYFAEFLGRIGWPEGPILMVGNDLDHDVRGAQEMGIPVFWINGKDNPASHGQPAPNGSGGLADVLPWLDSLPGDALMPDFTSASAMVGTLRGAPAAMTTLLALVSKTDWTQRPQADAWCLTEIVCHLRDVEREVNLPRLHKVLQENNPFIPGVDSDTWAEERAYRHQDGPAALEAFITTRIEILKTLDQLSEDQWNRSFRHAIFGPSKLKELVRIMAGHERLHGRQIYQGLPASVVNKNQRN